MATPAPNRKRRLTDGGIDSAPGSATGTPAPPKSAKREKDKDKKRRPSTAAYTHPPLLALPPELHRHLFNFIQLPDIYTLSKACKELRVSPMLLETIRKRIPFLLSDLLRFSGGDYEALFGPRPVTPRNEYFEAARAEGGDWVNNGLILPPPKPAVPDPNDEEAAADNAQDQPTTPAATTTGGAAATPSEEKPMVVATPKTAVEPSTAIISQTDLPAPSAENLAALYRSLALFITRFINPVQRKVRRCQGRQIGERILACALGNFLFSKEGPEYLLDMDVYRSIVYELPSRFEELGWLLRGLGILESDLIIVDILESLNICWEDEQEGYVPEHNSYWPFSFCAYFFRAVDFNKYRLRRFVEALWTMAHSQIDSAHEILHHVSHFLLDMQPPKSSAKYAFDRFHNDAIIEEIRKVWRKRLFLTVFPDEAAKEEQREKDRAEGKQVEETASEKSSESENEYAEDEDGASDSSGTFMTDASDADFSGSEEDMDEWGQGGEEWSESDDEDGDFEGEEMDDDDDDEDGNGALGPYLDHSQHHDDHPGFVIDSDDEVIASDDEDAESEKSWVTEDEGEEADVEDE